MSQPLDMKTFTREEAEQLGYHVTKASAFEVGLVKGEQGVKTWWGSEFDRKLPDLGHPKILEAVAANEELLAEWPPRPTLKKFCAQLDNNFGRQPLESVPLYDLLRRELKEWRDPEQVAKMTAEYKNLVDIYTRAAHTLGMKPDDNFDALDKLADIVRQQLDAIRFQADSWSNTGDTESLRQAMRMFVRWIDTITDYQGPGRFFVADDESS